MKLYLKLVYIEFAKKVANNYCILLGIVEYFSVQFSSMFCSIWCNANKKWPEESNIEEGGWKRSEKGIEPI